MEKININLMNNKNKIDNKENEYENKEFMFDIDWIAHINELENAKGLKKIKKKIKHKLIKTFWVEDVDIYGKYNVLKVQDMLKYIYKKINNIIYTEDLLTNLIVKIYKENDYYFDNLDMQKLFNDYLDKNLNIYFHYDMLSNMEESELYKVKKIILGYIKNDIKVYWKRTITYLDILIQQLNKNKQQLKENKGDDILNMLEFKNELCVLDILDDILINIIKLIKLYKIEKFLYKI